MLLLLLLLLRFLLLRLHLKKKKWTWRWACALIKERGTECEQTSLHLDSGITSNNSLNLNANPWRDRDSIKLCTGRCLWWKTCTHNILKLIQFFPSERSFGWTMMVWMMWEEHTDTQTHIAAQSLSDEWLTDDSPCEWQCFRPRRRKERIAIHWRCWMAWWWWRWWMDDKRRHAPWRWFWSSKEGGKLSLARWIHAHTSTKSEWAKRGLCRPCNNIYT